MSPWPAPEINATAVADALLDRLTNTLAIASSLATAGRTIELSGLQAATGRLCAHVLDLPPDLGLRFRPALVDLQGRINALEALVRRPPGGAPT